MTSSGTGSSTVMAMAAGAPGALRPTAMLPMLILCSPRMVPTLPIMPGLSSLRIKSVLFGDEVDREAQGLDDKRLHPGSEEGPAHDALLVALRGEPERDEARVVRALRDARGLDPQAPLLGECGRVHEVQRLVHHQGQKPLRGRDV